MTREHEIEIRALLKAARLEALTDDVIAGDMSVADVRRLAVNVTAWLDEATSGVMPSTEALEDGSVPGRVLEKARALVAGAVADAIDHVPPKGRPN